MSDKQKILENLVKDCCKDLAQYLPPDSGITASQALSKLLERLDGPQAREALGED